MRKLLAALLLVPSLALAQSGLLVGVGGEETILRSDTDSEHLNTLLTTVEYQSAIDDSSVHWLGITSSFALEQFAGAGVMYYYGIAKNTVYVGIGPGAVILGPETEALDKRTAFGGVEAAVEIWKEVGESTLPITAFVGYYPISDRDLGFEVVRFGVRVKTELLSTP